MFRQDSRSSVDGIFFQHGVENDSNDKPRSTTGDDSCGPPGRPNARFVCTTSWTKPSMRCAVVRSDGKHVQAVMYPQQPGMAFLEAAARRLAYLLPCANTSNTSRGKAYVERCGFRSSSDEGERSHTDITEPASRPGERQREDVRN